MCKQLFSSLSLIGVTALFFGPGVSRVSADVNPALSYYQAFLLAPDISEADFDYLATNNLWSPVLPEHFGQLVGRYDAEFRILRQAAKSSVPCDWGFDFSQAPMTTLLPHLARCKAAMIGARYRVAWHLQQNRQSDARDDLLAAFALARNVSRDRTVISALVQIAAEAIGCNVIAENFGKFSPKTLQEIVQGIDAAPAQGTIAAAVAFEKTAFHDWLTSKIKEVLTNNPGDETTVMAKIREILTPYEQGAESMDKIQPEIWEQLSQASGNSSEGILKVLDAESLSYDRLVSILALPYADFDSQANSFRAELKPSQAPLLEQGLGAELKAKQREFKMQVWLAMLHTAVAYKLEGDPGLLSVNDPCGQGPFAFKRFAFEGADRGFELKSAFTGSGFPEILIFQEKSGPPFLLDGPHVGEARSLPKPEK